MIRRVLVLLGIGVFAGVLGILAAAVMPMEAEALRFDFTNCAEISAPKPVTCPGDTGVSSLTYTVSGVSLTASGSRATPPSPMNLFVKVEPPANGESGLGITSDPLGNHEISNFDYVSLNTSDLIAHGATSADVMINSVQAGEQFKVCSSASSTVLGTTCTPLMTSATVLTNVPVTLSTADPFVNVTAGNGDVLIFAGADANVVGVPEPASLALLVTGLVGLITVRRRSLR